MRYLFLILLLLPLPMTAATGRNAEIDSLMRCLDEAIKRSPEYVNQREERISDLRTMLGRATSANRRIDLYQSLYDEYKSYQNDSAIAYLDRALTLATNMGNDSLRRHFAIAMAYQCSLTGMYTEASQYLSVIDPATLSSDELANYYTSCNHLYGELAYYTQVSSLRGYYYQQADSLYARMCELLPHDDDTYAQRTILNLLADEDYDAALDVSWQWHERVPPTSRDYAIVAFYRFLVYKRMGDMDNAMYWVIQSTLGDVRHAVMDQGAMWELVNIVMDRGDLSRAYRYIAFSWECAERFGTRMRSWQIAPTLSKIDKDYQLKLSRSNNQLFVSVVITGVLSLMLLGMLIYVLRQRNNLAVARRNLRKKNAQLEEMNNQLSVVNAQLSDVNAQLSQANSQLNDSNRLKEVYIGHFLRQCSTYIGKMDMLRRQVGKLAKNRDFDKLYALTRDTDFSEQELEDLYNNFDKAFLRLFPDFVTEFNALLREEYRIQLDDKDQLNTTLRIFALIRLGIEDSSKIAEFLRYSVNTIYNYRARTKGWALAERDSFEEQVKSIGSRA